MSLPPLTPPEFFVYMAIAGVIAVVAVFLPVQLASKIRRVRRGRYRLRCRLCGYRFLRRDVQATCPHCGARNR